MFGYYKIQVIIDGIVTCYLQANAYAGIDDHMVLGYFAARKMVKHNTRGRQRQGGNRRFAYKMVRIA